LELQEMEHPVDLGDVLAFVRVAETGSFARAAERLGISKSIVSRRVARLEASVGARLLTRDARGARPTEVGASYRTRLAGVLAELEAAHEEVATAVSEVAGVIRVAAPLTFGVRHLAPILVDFMREHPRVELDLCFEDHTTDLVGGGFDLGIRIRTALPDSTLVARRLALVRRVVVASPAYLAARGTPARPDELGDHDVLLYSNASAAEQWRFRVGDRWEQARVGGRFRANNGDMMRAAVTAGLGLAILPTFIASDGLTTGELVTVLDDYPIEEGAVFAVMPPGRAATARVRALVDTLAKRLGPEPRWDPCWQAARAS
jgi:DNA-binding transcriptional LysR family regulator